MVKSDFLSISFSYVCEPVTHREASTKGGAAAVFIGAAWCAATIVPLRVNNNCRFNLQDLPIIRLISRSLVIHFSGLPFRFSEKVHSRCSFLVAYCLLACCR